MKLPKHIWDQLKNITADDFHSAFLKDGWTWDETKGAVRVYRHPDTRRVTIHYHPKKTFGPRLLKDLLEDIGWTPNDLKRLKLIK